MSAARFLLAGVASLVAAPVLPGQTVAELEARVHRLDSLVRVRREAMRHELDAGDRDTLHVGGFTLVTPRSLSPAARGGASIAWEHVRVAGGSWLARELARHPITLQPRNWPRGDDDRFVQATMTAWGGVPEIARTAASRRAADLAHTFEAIAEVAARSVVEGRLISTEYWDVSASMTQARLTTFDQGLAWPPVLGANVRSGGEAWASSQRSLRLTPSRSNRACLSGDAGACLVSLGLSGSARDAYEPSDYRWLLASGGAGVVIPYPDATACRDRGDVVACASVARPGFTPSLPTSREAQAAFVALALEVGGNEALDRMAATQGSKADRLAAAAGRPLVDVAAEWQRRTMASSIAVPSAELPGVLVALALGVAVAWLASRRVLA